MVRSIVHATMLALVVDRQQGQQQTKNLSALGLWRSGFCRKLGLIEVRASRHQLGKAVDNIILQAVSYLERYGVGLPKVYRSTESFSSCSMQRAMHSRRVGLLGHASREATAMNTRCCCVGWPMISQ